MENNPIVVLVVEPGKRPVLRALDGSLESLQAVVNGCIEQIMPFDDEVALVCNEDGKFCGETFNRALYDNNGEVYDIVAGTFFLCYAPWNSENYLSLPEELIHKYAEMYERPERFFRNPRNDKIIAIPAGVAREYLGIKYQFHEHEDSVDIEFMNQECEDVDWHTVPKDSEEYGRLDAVAKEWAGNLAIQKALAVAGAMKDEKLLDEVINAAVSASGEYDGENKSEVGFDKE